MNVVDVSSPIFDVIRLGIIIRISSSITLEERKKNQKGGSVSLKNSTSGGIEDPKDTFRNDDVKTRKKVWGCVYMDEECHLKGFRIIGNVVALLWRR